MHIAIFKADDICLRLNECIICHSCSWYKGKHIWTKCVLKKKLTLRIVQMFGLSKERPILDHHPKAHIHEIWRISWNLADFRWNLVDFIWISWNLADFIRISYRFQVKSGRFQVKSSRLHMDFMKSSGFQVKSSRFHMDFMKSAGFHAWNLLDFTWNPPDFERPIARNGKPYVLRIGHSRIGSW